jgi:hypothetical protein
MALEHIQICLRGRYLILSDSLSSLMAMWSRRITCKTHPCVYDIADLQQHYDLKLMWIPSHVRISVNKVADGCRQAVRSGTADYRIVAGQAMIKQWQHVWRTGDTGRFAHSIRPVVSFKPWFDGQGEERTFVTTISRVLSGHCSIRAHQEQFRIVGHPIYVCMMNYETVDHIIWECSRFEVKRPIGTRGREHKRRNTNPNSLRVSKVGSIEVMPQVPKGMRLENMRKPFFCF